MIKVPATDEGIEALETLVQTASASTHPCSPAPKTPQSLCSYTRGIAKRLEAGHDVSHIQSCRQLFISRS